MPSSELANVHSIPANHSIRKALIFLAAVFAVGWLLARLLAPAWSANSVLVHTTAETVSVFTSLAIFVIAWLTAGADGAVPAVVGFGYLAVAVFDAGHLLFYPGLPIAPAGHPDLTVRYWLAARLVEAGILYLAYAANYRRRFHNYKALAITLAAALGIAVFLFIHSAVLPVLFTGRQVTPLKIALELLVVILLLAAVPAVRRHAAREGGPYRALYLSLLLLIAVEISFTFYTSAAAFNLLFGHVLLVAQRCCLFQGVFVAAVVHPYRMLRWERQDFRDTFDGLLLGILTFNPAFTLSYINRRAQEMFNCRAEDVVGLSLEQVTARFERPEFGNRELGRPALADGCPRRGDIRTVVDGRGNVRKLKLDVYRLESGRIVFVYTDVSAEQELAVLQLQTQAILNSVPHLILLIDNDGTIVMCNRALTAAGIDASRLIGMPLADFFTWFGYRRQGAGRGGAPADGEAVLYEASDALPAGAPQTLLVQESEIRNLDGASIGRIIVATDLTQMKRSQEQTQQREKLAVIGQMAAGIVHEIRNPLTAIKGFNNLIQSQATDEVVREYAATVEEEVNNMNKVVNDFLAFARPRPPQLRTLSLNGLVESLATMLEGQAFIRNIGFAMHPAKTEKPVRADEGQLKQVILNIAQNGMEAVAAVPEPKLTVGTELSAQAEEMLLFITDNGAGLAPDVKAKLGTPFFTTKAKGTGLGLSICYQIVKEHGGRIEVESEPGRGTSFLLYFPVQPD